MNGLRQHLDEGFGKVTPSTCAAVADIRREEDRYWREDAEADKDQPE